MRKTFYFGKIRCTQPRRVNAVSVDVELRKCGGQETFIKDPGTGEKVVTGKTPEYLELLISGSIWNHIHSDIVYGGQCLDTIAEYKSQLSDPDTFEILYDLWQKYHLNGMHAGTPEQEAAVAEWEKTHKYDYRAACEMLRERGLYEVNYTGLAAGRRYENEPYQYGHAWLVQELPADVIAQVKELLTPAIPSV